MKKNLFLSSVLVMGMVSFGAYAADELITGGAGTCTVDVLGVSDNNATANTIAVWSINEYTLAPGEYLNVTETSVDKAACPAGSYCVGGSGFTVDNAATSIATCPAEYPNSATGAGAQNQCYTACTVATANIAHATAVAGNDYFGDGADACYATACATGYHVDGGGLELVEKDPLIPVDYTLAGNGFTYIDQFGNADSRASDAGLTANNTWASEFDYGVIYGKTSCQPKADPAYEYIINNEEVIFSGSKSMETVRSELTALSGPIKAEAMIGFIEVMMGGGEGMSEEEILESLAKFLVVYSESSDKNYSADSSGQHCYCQMDGFMPTGGTREIVTSAPWVFLYEGIGSADDCASNCARGCANALRNDYVGSSVFRAAAVGALEAVESGGICAANTINIDWNPDNGGEHTKNMCTYDGEITLPTPDPVKPGYTFTGWKLAE